eukprot:CAMPEP_0197072072 /NCGR_PEP_ID=MMETSP1384-20130603/209911_1 /TAXON_ID=29189 /ORGANISM="Ammonia sp." /LENGTH=331 /DNA_ID=CAMNT_0042510885 /DNA_START=92 /DNA_END=1087 /DNA_ORIENTATION=-
MAATLKKKSKFNSIETTLDTGLHYGNIQIIPKRRGELFRRLKTTEMVTLLQLYLNEISKDAESIANLLQDTNDDEDEDHKEKSIANNIFHHYEYPEKDEENFKQAANAASAISSVFLLLDIRDEAEFEKYHIKSARYYDTTTLRRDKLGNEIYAFKNKPGKIIIICCEEENVGIRFANDLCKKYIDNIFLLTSSVKRFCLKYPRYYDTTTLRRDKLGNEIYAFKNKPGKIIIICCEEENVGIRFANDLCKKYIDNIFLLTSSVKRFCLKYPDLCVGHSFPEKPVDQKQPKARIHLVDWRPSNKRASSTKFSHSPSVKSMMSTASSVRTWKP